MSAGVARADCLEAMLGQLARHLFVGKQCAKMSLHFGAVTRDEIIFARSEQMFRVLPGRANQRNAAGKRFEWPDGRNPAERFDVRPSRDMHGDFVAREHFRGSVIRQPATVLNSRLVQKRARRLRVTNAVDLCPQSKSGHRFDEKFSQLRSAFVVSPVPNPNEIALEPSAREWMEDARIRRLMPGPGLLRPAVIAVNFGERLAISEHAIISREIVAPHLLRRRDGAVMSVVKEEAVIAGTSAVFA